MYRLYGKRWLDAVISFVALLMLSPLFLILILLVRVKLGSPVFFCQKRPGLNEKIFTLYKFRTMTDKKDEEGNLLSDEQRLTAFGRFLRKYSLDELPELFNILKGDMSLIGPRPLLVEYLSRYNEEQKRRHEVRPGLSGLAQVSGRNTLSWEEKFELDIKYVNELSFFLDVKLVFQSLWKAFVKTEGISQQGPATAEVFRGTAVVLGSGDEEEQYA